MEASGALSRDVAETYVLEAGLLDVSIPAIAQQLDTTRAIEENIRLSVLTYKNWNEEEILSPKKDLNSPSRIIQVDTDIVKYISFTK